LSITTYIGKLDQTYVLNIWQDVFLLEQPLIWYQLTIYWVMFISQAFQMIMDGNNS